MGHEALKVVTATDLAGKQSISEKDQPNGYVGIDSSSGDNVVDSVAIFYAPGTAIPMLSLSEFFIGDGAGQISVSFGGRQLISATGVTVADWSASTLSAGGFVSVDWASRLLVNSTNLTSLDWENSILYRASVLSVNWGNRETYDTSAVRSIDWDDRELVSVNNLGLINWSGSSPVTSVINVSDSSSVMKLGFYGATAAVKQTVTGSKGANAALTSLLSKLAAIGLITDSTT